MITAPVLKSRVTNSTVVEDVHRIIKYLDENQITSSGKSGWLPNKALPEINERLCNPIQVDCKRVVQNLMPHIHVLMHLIQMLGLIKKTKGKSSKGVSFSIDREAYKRWSAVPEEEQYLNLLSIFVWPDFHTCLDSERGMFNLIYMFQCLFGHKKIIEFSTYKEQKACYSLRPLVSAGAELFGMLEIKHGEPDPGGGWRVLSLKPTTFGLQITKHVKDVFLSHSLPEQLGGWRTVFLKSLSRSFPSWKAVFEPTQARLDGSMVCVRVTLWKDIKRWIAISTDTTLDALNDMIMDAFEFDTDHLHCFTFKESTGIKRKIYHPQCSEGESSSEWTLAMLPLQIGDEIELLFDFGDSWLFSIKLEELPKKWQSLSSPTVIKSAGEPPEQYSENSEW